jgi:hypothetical protein
MVIAIGKPLGMGLSASFGFLSGYSIFDGALADIACSSFMTIKYKSIAAQSI